MSSSSPSPMLKRQKPITKRTYGSGARIRTFLPSSPKSTVSFTPSSPARDDVLEDDNREDEQRFPLRDSYASSLVPTSNKRKRLIGDDDPSGTLDAFFSAPRKSLSTLSNVRPTKRPKLATTKPPTTAPLVQMHLALSSKPTVRTCQDCGLSYTIGAPEDELLHKRHHARVLTGVEWTREESKVKGVEVVEEGVRLGKDEVGRILAFKADVKGKLASKLSLLLDTVNTELSAPALTPEALAASKIFIFVLPSSATREKIVGCVVAQHITEALRVVSQDADNALLIDGDADGGLFCDPKPVPTPLGISRLWTSSQHRHKGIATRLLDSACRKSVYGCVLDQKKGQVAFSQPTNSGRAVMMKWGGGAVRVFTES